MVCVICMLDSMGSRLFGHRDLLYLRDRQTRGEEDLQCDLHKRGKYCGSVVMYTLSTVLSALKCI